MSLKTISPINIDLHNSKYISINAKQHDRASRFVLITCYDHGSVFPLYNSSHYAYIRYRKPDDLGVFNSCEITDDGKILIELSEQMLAVSGKCYADVVIANGQIDVNIDEEVTITNVGSILSTMTFCINVIETAFDNIEIESSHEYDALNDLLIKATADYTEIITVCNDLAENAKISETNAKASEENAATSELNASNSEKNASVSESNTKDSEANAKTYAENAKLSETNANASEENAKKYADNASASEQMVTDKAKESSDYADISKSYAVGGTDTRLNEDTDNSKYYYTQAKAISDGIDGSLVPMGTVSFEQLQSVSKDTGYMYHINEDFVTDDTFKSGAGVSYTAGTNVYYTADGYWDCFVGSTLNNVLVTIDALNATIENLQRRIAELENQTVLEITD